MATITERTYTPEDLLEIDDRPTPDLVDGQLEEREVMGQEADLINGTIIGILTAFAGTTLPALVNGPECGYQIFPHDARRVRFPDVSFTRLDRVPDRRPAKGHSRLVPDLVVKVVSPNERAIKLQAKLADFRAAGAPMIWVVYPEFRALDVLSPDSTSRRLEADAVLDGAEALPGFQCHVAQLFE